MILFGRIRAALRDEPNARRFLIANLVDDVGVAVSVWAMQILQTDMMHDQRTRASLVIPVLFMMVLGTALSGPLADFARRWSATALPRWRRNVLVVARGVETVALGALVTMIASGPMTVSRILPYALVSGFLKTALRPTRIALAVDLLECEAPEEGVDETGAPRAQKVHLASFASLTSQLSSAAVLGGLLLGGKIMGAAHGRTWLLFAFDVATNIVFLVVLASIPLRKGAIVEAPSVSTPPRPRFELARFLLARAQRPLVALLACAWLIEFMDELYDGKMIVRHVLGGTVEAVRFSEIAWTLASLGAVALVPALLSRVRLGVAFTLAMLADGLVMAAAGAIASRGAAAAVVPFALVLGADRALTGLAGTMTTIAQASATSSAMRGRLAGAWQMWVIVTCIVAEGVATEASEAWGIGPMMRVAGFAQAAAVVAFAIFGGRGLAAIHQRSGGARMTTTAAT